MAKLISEFAIGLGVVTGGGVDAAIYIVSNRGSISVRIVRNDRAARRETHND